MIGIVFKGAGAIVSTVVVAALASVTGNAIFSHKTPEKPERKLEMIKVKPPQG